MDFKETVSDYEIVIVLRRQITPFLEEKKDVFFENTQLGLMLISK